MKLSQQELFDLGVAYGSFSVGEIDQGIHCILPVRDVETGAEMNDVFTSLMERINMIKYDPYNVDYEPLTYQEQIMNVIIQWCIDNDIETGRTAT